MGALKVRTSISPDVWTVIAGGLPIVEITQAAYDALTTPDPAVLYVITDGEVGLTQTEADTRYVNVDGDTMTGPLTVTFAIDIVDPPGAIMWDGDEGMSIFKESANDLAIAAPSNLNMHASIVMYGGDVILDHHPTQDYEAASKRYVDTLAINAQTGTTYTLVLADQGKLVTLSNAAAITLTVPLNSAAAFPIGTQIHLLQLGAGAVTVTQSGGVTVNATPSKVFRAQYSAATLIKLGTDNWVLIGDT